MIVSEMHSWFNILLDHYNEPYFIDAEVDEFLNSATVEFVNDIVFKEYFPSSQAAEKGPQSLSAIESVIQGSEILQPLIVEDVAVNAVSGKVSISGINSSLQAKVSDVNASLMHVIGLTKSLPVGESTVDRVVRYVRHNDKQRFKQNVFKSPSARNPIYSFVHDGLSIVPLDDEEYKITLLKYPKRISLEDGSDSDMPSFTHQRIVAYAIALAGVASRDDVMLQLQTISGNGTNRQQ